MAGPRILIAGAGIGGLTAAIALAQAGFAVEVHEQAPALKELGAGVSLSRAVRHVLDALGLRAAVAAAATVTADIAFLHYRTGRLLAGAIDDGAGSGDPDGPLASLQIHRADLHAILVAALERVRPGAIRLGHQVAGVEGATLRFADGGAAAGDLVIGADGLRSAVRRGLLGPEPARFTGQVAYRFLVERSAAAPFMAHGRAAVFQGPARVFNRYTIRHGAIMNCVGVARTDGWQDEGWSIPATRDEMLADFAGWHPQVTGLMAQADHLIKWGIFDRAPLDRWSVGPATLLGDAAHPMLPFLGLGAAMAIEDAMILARALGAESDPALAFARYEAARRPRTAEVHAQSQHQSAFIQASDPDRVDFGSAPSHEPGYYAYDPVTATI